jgi:hypothetical protein
MAFAFVGEIAKALTDARDAIPLIKKELERKFGDISNPDEILTDRLKEHDALKEFTDLKLLSIMTEKLYKATVFVDDRSFDFKTFLNVELPIRIAKDVSFSVKTVVVKGIGQKDFSSFVQTADRVCKKYKNRTPEPMADS